jgi:hypothetical protein
MKRLWLSGGSVLLLVGVHGYLLFNERVLSLDPEQQHDVIEEDPLIGLAYNAAQRRANLEQFGLDEDQVATTMDKIERLEAKGQDERIKSMLKNAGDVQALGDALCGQLSDVRPRYAAMRFLVLESGGERDVLNINRASALSAQSWALEAPIAGVYETVELTPAREEDATRMGVAAVLLRQEDAVLNGRTPWGTGLFNPWSWDDVSDTWPEADALVTDYFALMHLTAEMAQMDGIICD